MIDHYDGSTGRLVLSMTRACASDCSTPGQAADESVAYWCPRVIWHASCRELRTICAETGAWDDTRTADPKTIKHRVLWMAACEWREEARDMNPRERGDDDGVEYADPRDEMDERRTR